MLGEDEQSYANTLAFCRKLRDLGVHGITPLIATPYPGTELYHICERFGFLRYPDAADVLCTVSYAHAGPEHVQISTPFCTHDQAYARWREMMDMFPTFHNVRKEGRSERPLTGVELRERRAVMEE